MNIHTLCLLCTAWLTAVAAQACNGSAHYNNGGTPAATCTHHTAAHTDAASGTLQRQLAALRQWKAGTEVSPEAVRAYGMDSCFTSQRIDDALYRRIYGKSFKTYCTVPRSSLRYIRVLHYTADRRILTGELVCHKDIAADLTDIFRKLYDAQYAIESIRLIDDYDADDTRSMNANNTSCFNFRTVAGSRKLSNHSMGKAVDLNPLYNPYVKRRADGSTTVNPEKGRRYADRSAKFGYKIDRNDLAYRLFTQHGFRWGGNYRSLKDYQHFEKP